MKAITRKDITDILDKMEVSYTVKEPSHGTEMYEGHDTMFMITKDYNIIYFSDFEVSPDDTSCYEVSGDMFFITPSGDLSGDFVPLNLALFIKKNLIDCFIIQPEEWFEYVELDRYIRELMKGSNVSGMSLVIPKNNSVTKEEFIY